MRTPALLAAFAVCVAVSLPPSPARAGGDLAAGFFYVGGGLGGTAPDIGLVPRFATGVGFYAPFIYSSISLEINRTAYDPFVISAVGSTGIAIPAPVVHPMVGVRVGVGGAVSELRKLGEFLLGAQVGVIVRKFDGHIGIRIMVDGDAVFLGGGERDLFIYGQIVPTVALVL